MNVRRKKNDKDVRKRETWASVNGKIPDGHCLIYLDRNKNNKAMNNLACVSKSVQISMTQQNLFSTMPEVTRAGIAIAEHRMAILSVIKRTIAENKAMGEKERNPEYCKICRKTKCKFWHYSLKKHIPPTCTKYNVPIIDIDVFLKQHRQQLKAQARRPVNFKTYLKRAEVI